MVVLSQHHMERVEMKKTKEFWIDNIKIFACLLVLLGHLFQGLTGAGVLPKNDLYRWFNYTIYTFHVPLFFICSGYLYQKFSRVDSFDSWGRNILKKILVLGIPYTSFTIMTWIIKLVTGNSGTNSIDNIISTLFFQPTAPFWFLYALFFMFVVTITVKSKKMYGMLFFISFFTKLLYIFYIQELELLSLPYALVTLMQNEIWFVLGMGVAFWNWSIKLRKIGLGVVGVATSLACSIFVSYYNVHTGVIAFVLGLMFCVSFMMVFIGIDFYNSKNNKFTKLVSKYTMHIFLMHSIFVATVRTILLRMGIESEVLHICLEIFAGIVGPIIVGIIMQKTIFLEFFIFPSKVLKLTEKK